MAARRLGHNLGGGISDVVKVPSMYPYSNIVGGCRYMQFSQKNKMLLRVYI